MIKWIVLMLVEEFGMNVYTRGRGLTHFIFLKEDDIESALRIIFINAICNSNGKV